MKRFSWIAIASELETNSFHALLGRIADTVRRFLQQTMDLTDKAAIEQLAFNIQWHYALNIPEESDDAKYISEKTLCSMRQVMIVNHLDEMIFDAIADTLYGSDTNDQIAKVAGVELVAPTHKGRGKNLLSQFCFDEKGLVTQCPAGHRPDTTSPKTKRSNYSAGFDLERCLACPLSSTCPVKSGKKNAYLRYNEKRYRLAKRRTLEVSKAFIDDYRWRAGVEAAMSEFDRRTRVKKLRVRGMPAVRFYARMKATGLNIHRAGAVRKARRKAQGTNGASIGLVDTFIHAVKERIH